MPTPCRPTLLLPLCVLLACLAGCPNEGEESTGTSATESGAMADDSDGDPGTSSPSTSTTEDPGMSEPTSSSTTLPDDDSTTDTTTTTAGTTEDSDTSGSTGDDATTTTGTSTGDEAECGNGLVEGIEECDKGEENADAEYGGCNLDCTLQPHCGDGDHQPELGEPCDPSDENFVEAAVCSDVCTWEGVIAFVTSQTYTGSLGGIDGADAICVQLANTAGLVKPEGYRAWLSVGENDTPNTRIPKVNAPYYRLDGEKLAENIADLLDGKLKSPLNVNELKEPDIKGKVWTNTTPAGNMASDMDDCQSFHSMEVADAAIVGRPDDTDAGWTQQALMASCIDTWRLYCFSEAF